MPQDQIVNNAREFNPFSFILGDGFSMLVYLIVILFFLYMIIQFFSSARGSGSGRRGSRR